MNYAGKNFLEPGMKGKLRKEPDNKYDRIGKKAVGEVVYMLPAGGIVQAGEEVFENVEGKDG